MLPLDLDCYQLVLQGCEELFDGRRLQREPAPELGSHAAELADHFSLSGEAADLTSAIRYSELAARNAMRTSQSGARPGFSDRL